MVQVVTEDPSRPTLINGESLGRPVSLLSPTMKHQRTQRAFASIAQIVGHWMHAKCLSRKTENTRLPAITDAHFYNDLYNGER